MKDDTILLLLAAGLFIYFLKTKDQLPVPPNAL